MVEVEQPVLSDPPVDDSGCRCLVGSLPPGAVWSLHTLPLSVCVLCPLTAGISCSITATLNRLKMRKEHRWFQGHVFDASILRSVGVSRRGHTRCGSGRWWSVGAGRSRMKKTFRLHNAFLEQCPAVTIDFQTLVLIKSFGFIIK